MQTAGSLQVLLVSDRSRIMFPGSTVAVTSKPHRYRGPLGSPQGTTLVIVMRAGCHEEMEPPVHVTVASELLYWSLVVVDEHEKPLVAETELTG